MIKIKMDNGDFYNLNESLDEVIDTIFDYNTLFNKEILKNDIVRITDSILINPSHIASIEEFEMIFNLSRKCFQERKV